MDSNKLHICFMSDTDKKQSEGTSLERARSALAHLTERPATPSIAAQIRQLLPDIEQAQAAGASRKEILEALRHSGLDVSMKTFATALARARRKRAKKTGNAQQQPKTDQGDPAKPRRRTGLEMPAAPRKFHWDPLEEPKITFGGKDIKDIQEE